MPGKGLLLPIHKLTTSVKDVIVTDTAASASIFAVLSGTLMVIGVLLQAASITKVSSIPIPIGKKNQCPMFCLHECLLNYVHVRKIAYFQFEGGI